MNAPTPTAHLSPAIAARQTPAALIDALKARFSDRCSTALVVREQHGRDESAFAPVPPPSAVVFAESTQDVADAVRLASEFSVPVIPFGIGSSLEGHLLAVQGGISVDVSPRISPRPPAGVSRRISRVPGCWWAGRSG